MQKGRASLKLLYYESFTLIYLNGLPTILSSFNKTLLSTVKWRNNKEYIAK